MLRIRCNEKKTRYEIYKKRRGSSTVTKCSKNVARIGIHFIKKKMVFLCIVHAQLIKKKIRTLVVDFLQKHSEYEFDDAFINRDARKNSSFSQKW